MTQLSRLTVNRIGEIFLCLLLSPIPIAGQFVLPFLYTPLKSVFPNQLGSLPKHEKVTSQHVRISESWTVAQTYSQTMGDLITKVHILLAPPSFTAANLADLDYSWSYNIPIDAVNPSLNKTAGFMQEELLKFVGHKFLFDVNNVATRLGIPTSNLWNSYDPANWETVVHVIINESSSAFSRRLALPSVNSLAELVNIHAQVLLKVNLGRFEDLVFPFITKKVILDANTTSYLINTSAIIHGESYNNVTVAKVLQLHENLTMSLKQFGILYNLTTEQAKAIGEATFYEIFRLCDVSTETILQITLPEVAWRVVGSVHITPPCPMLIAIKGKSIASYDSVINPQTTTVLEILTAVSNLTWREVREAVSASLPDWEFLDSVTLPQLAEISGISLETLLNSSVSQAVELVLSLRTDGSLNNKTEIHRAFIRSLLEEKFNLSLSEVANLTQTVEASFSNAPSSQLFRSFLNATIIYFGLNLSEIVASVQVSEVALYNLPRQEWNNVTSAIVNPVVRSEAALLQISTTKLIQYLGIASVELTISQLKEFMTNQILVAKRRKRKFENDPISAYLSQNSVSDAKYLNSTVRALVLGASGFSSDELKLIYGLNSDEIFVLASLRVRELPLYCALNTTGLKDRTSFNITAEIAGINGDQAVCRSTRFYIAARFKNMSVLQTEFSPVSNSSISFVNLVETVTGLPWRRNVWAFGVKMEDWTVLYVLNKVLYVEVTSGLNLDPYQSRTLLQIFQTSVQLYQGNNTNLRLKIRENRVQTLNILYELFNTNEDELIELIPETKNQYDDFYPIQVFSRMIQHYLVGKFNVSVNNLESSLDLNPGDLNKLAPTEWPEMIPFVKAEVIRSGQNQLGVSLSNFARLLNETPQSVQSLTFAQLEFKWDSVISRLKKGKAAFDTHSVFQIISAIGITNDSLNDVTVLQFIEGRINVTRSEMLLLYNFSSIAIDVLSNYTFLELPSFCALTKENLLNRRPLQIVVSLLGHDGDMSCRKIAAVALASTITVTELAAKFSLGVKDNISLLTLFEDLFTLPWPKIAWAVNASLPDWPILGAVSLDNVATLTSQSKQNMKSQKSFREITMQLLRVPSNSYAQLMNTYRSKLVNQASALFGVNASKICDGCEVVDILWNSLTQLHLLIDFDPYKLPNGLNVSFYEFNLTVPSQWPLLVQPIVRDAYVKTALALGIDRARLSSLLQTTTVAVLSLNLTQYQAFLSQSIQPLIVAKTAFTSSPLAELVAAKGLRLSALANVSVFDVIDAVLNVSVQNISFIFNWTTKQQGRLKNYTLVDITYCRGVELQNLGRESLFRQVEYILDQSLFPCTPPSTTPAPCKRGFERVGNAKECIDINECSSKLRCGDDSLCQNYRGGFGCECTEPGYFKLNINGNCKPCKTFRGTLTITNREFSSFLNDKSTENFFDLKESFEDTVNDEFRKSTVGKYYYGCRVQGFREGSVIVDFLIFTNPDFTGSIQDLQNALVSRVNNSNLGPYTVTRSAVAVKDFDECKAHQDNCGQHATCDNTEGSFACKCNDGFDGDGVTCEAAFFKTMWWIVIVAGFLLLLIVIIIVFLVIKRPKPSGRYGMEMEDYGHKNQAHRKNSEANKISYRNGDVYYKDKDGNLRPGTAHRSGNGIEQTPHTPHFHEEDDLQSANSMAAKTPFELAVERNKRISGEYSSVGRSPFEVAAQGNARSANRYETAEELNMTDLPIASITS